MAAMIEGQARAEAKVRQVAGQSAGRDIQHGKLVGGQLATIQKQPSISHKARDEIAEAVGMATTTLRTGCGKPPPAMSWFVGARF